MEHAQEVADEFYFSEGNISLGYMVDRHQQLQEGDTCALCAISTGLNILLGRNTTCQDVVGAFTIQSWPRYSWLLNGGASLPYQQERIVNELSDKILRKSDNLPTAETTTLTTYEMIAIINDPNRVALFTYNTVKGSVRDGHTTMLAAYSLAKGFGFLNSGFGRDEDTLTWISPNKMEAYIEDPIGLHDSNFLVISKGP